MKSRQEMKLALVAEPFLAPGETVVRALVAVSKGLTQHEPAAPGARAARVSLAPQVGLVLTTQRLLTLRLSTSYGFGHGGEVQELLSAVPLAEVDEIDVRRRLLRQTITVTVGGESVRLEANGIASGKELAESLVRARDDEPADGDPGTHAP